MIDPKASDSGNFGPRGASHSVNDVNASDQILIDRCLAGQTDAFGELVTRYQDRLYGTLVSMLGSVHDARDDRLTGGVRAGIFQKLSTFRRESAFYSWLFRIAYNAAVSRHAQDGVRESTFHRGGP